MLRQHVLMPQLRCFCKFISNSTSTAFRLLTSIKSKLGVAAQKELHTSTGERISQNSYSANIADTQTYRSSRKKHMHNLFLVHCGAKMLPVKRMQNRTLSSRQQAGRLTTAAVLAVMSSLTSCTKERISQRPTHRGADGITR
jgi:hypothetical protein